MTGKVGDQQRRRQRRFARLHWWLRADRALVCADGAARPQATRGAAARRVTIEDHARIGANAVVLTDVSAGATAVGIPARVLDRGRTADDVDE